jgi:hypothetical protein
VSLESEQLVARYGVPDFAGAVVASSDELVARLVECAIGERQDMGSKDLEQEKITCFIAAELFYQFYKKTVTHWKQEIMTMDFHDLRFESSLSLYMSLRRCGFLLSDISGSSNTIWFTITSMSVLTTWIEEDKQTRQRVYSQ